MPFPLAAVLGGVSALGKVFGGAGQGRAQERQAQNDFLQRENALKLGQFNTQQQALLSLLGLDERATMDRAQLGIAAPSARAKQAVIGSLLARLQPSSVQAPAGINVGKLSGGLAGALGGPGMQQAGNLLQMQALRALASGSDVPGATNYAQRGMLTAPTMAAYKQPGKGESFLSMLGLAGGLAGAAQGFLRPRSAPSPTNIPQGAG